MKLFITWSGPNSKKVALKLRDWIGDVLQNVRPWMSEHDIKPGERWGPELAGALQETSFGIICLTKTNVHADWLLFECGALSKTLKDTFVCPYLIGMEQTDVPAGPLTQFQGKSADRAGTFEILRAINSVLTEGALRDEQLVRTFELWWPELEKTLSVMTTENEGAQAVPSPDMSDMVKETLSIARELSRRSWTDNDSVRMFNRERRRISPSASVSPPSSSYRGFSGVDPILPPKEQAHPAHSPSASLSHSMSGSPGDSDEDEKE